jgi:hypothetical protein
MGVWKTALCRSRPVQNHSNPFIGPRKNPQLELEIFIPIHFIFAATHGK